MTSPKNIRWSSHTGSRAISHATRSRVLPSLLVTLLCVLLAPHCRAQDAPVVAPVITPVEGWATVFGGQKVTWRFNVRGFDVAPARASWALSLDERVVSRGEVAVKAGEPVAVTVDVPPVKPGVVLPLTLTVSVSGNDNTKPATGTKRFWVYPTDAFAERSEWLKKLNLRLYDPEGATARRLDAEKIPYRAVGNPDALSEGDGGVAIIGEGLSFADYRALAGAMTKAASSGHSVLCLAPTGGTIPIPGSEGVELVAPSQLRFAHADIITELDKRLDAAVWPKGASAASSLVLKAARDQVVGEVQAGAVGWSWLECRYAAPRSTLVVCSFGIINHWDASPTPRFLFARLLEYLAPSRPEENTAVSFQRSQK